MTKTAAESVDSLIPHLDTVVANALPEVVQFYVGFFAVTAVAAIEDSLKSTLVSCAERVDPRFGAYVDNANKRLNAQVKIEQIANHLAIFGEEPRKKFKSRICSFVCHFQGLYRTDPTSRYANLVLARHTFAHGGQITNITYNEAKKGYRVGKTIIALAQNSLEEALASSHAATRAQRP